MQLWYGPHPGSDCSAARSVSFGCSAVFPGVRASGGREGGLQVIETDVIEVKGRCGGQGRDESVPFGDGVIAAYRGPTSPAIGLQRVQVRSTALLTSAVR